MPGLRGIQTMTPVILRRPGGGKVGISQAALTCILNYIQDGPEKAEAGGVLLGRHILDSEDVVIDLVTVPMPGDCRSRYCFRRSQRPHQKAIDRAWRKSHGTCAYLGEWHTHPESVPRPSGVDCREWRRKLEEDIYPGDTLFFVIAGTDTVRVWEGSRSGCDFQLIGEFPAS